MLIASLLFGISASLDALLVGLSYGIRQIRIRFWQNSVISLITLAGTCLSVGLGHRLAAYLPEVIGNSAGSLILVILGLYYIVRWMAARLKKQDADAALSLTDGEKLPALQMVSAQSLRPGELFSLSLTLSLNNLSAGLSASIAGMPLFPAAVSTLACSVLFLYAGNRLGRHSLLQLAGEAADPISGILLIGLGLLQFFI